MPTFGELLKAWREQAGLNKAQLARLVHKSSTYIGNLEHDKSNHGAGSSLIGRDVCVSLARVLHVQLLDVLIAAYVPELLDAPSADLQARRLVAAFHELPQTAQAEVVVIVDALWRMYAKPPSAPKSEGLVKTATKHS